MLAATIIVLREMLEMCLIIGMISAALNDLKNKKQLLLAGVISGVTLSIILALSFRYITNLFDGDGQEIMNMIILFISILCIAFTILWIKTHAKKLHSKISQASQNFIDKKINCLPILLIITLAISREGAEIILFLHGVSAAGTNAPELALGIFIGTCLGISSGVLIYLGLLRISPKYFFKAINILLILLAAGMASQLGNYLNSTDIISALSSTMWDSSWLISEESLVGNILHGLLGYSSHPTQLQFILYSFTIFILSLSLKKKN